jgi:tRNA(Arg) A34 adenosine deaminase TadA
VNSQRDSPVTAARVWAELDEPWREAFRQAWEALRTGNIAIGAVASKEDGTIVHAARNRVLDKDGPPGEIFGSALAHAEMNVLARLRFRSHRNMVLTTTLQPCLQCAAAIRLGPIATVRFAGPDPYWDGCHDFGRLSPREAGRVQPARSGPRRDGLGVFASLISMLGPGLGMRYEEAMRLVGQGPTIDLAHHLQDAGEADRLAGMEVNEAIEYLWPRLGELTGLPRDGGPPCEVGRGRLAQQQRGDRDADRARHAADDRRGGRVRRALLADGYPVGDDAEEARDQREDPGHVVSSADRVRQPQQRHDPDRRGHDVRDKRDVDIREHLAEGRGGNTGLLPEDGGTDRLPHAGRGHQDGGW